MPSPTRQISSGTGWKALVENWLGIGRKAGKCVLNRESSLPETNALAPSTLYTRSSPEVKDQPVAVVGQFERA